MIEKAGCAPRGFIDGQLAQPPRFNHIDGRVPKDFLLTITAPNLSTNGAVYYTLDGTDPRRPQGAISTNAIRYTDADSHPVRHARHRSSPRSCAPPGGRAAVLHAVVCTDLSQD